MKSPHDEYYPSALTIAGSDSGGGAGIQADLRTFAAFGVYGCTAITAITAQNPMEVSRIDSLPAEAVAAQIETVLDKILIRTIKTGMLFNSEIIDKVAELLKNSKLPLVVDPVMVASSGAELLKPDAVRSLKDKLLPLAAWITPNIPEAEILTGIKITGREKMLEAALKCSREWSCSCILKTGHMIAKGSNVASDIVCYDGKLYELSSPLITDCSASHGTGCTLSAALTAVLSLGFQWKDALMMAKGFVYGSLVESVTVGNDIDAMYPPMESYQGKTLLTRIEG